MNALMVFYAVCILQCFICTNTHFVIFYLFGLTSQTDSVRSRSQSGYPDREVHTLFLLRLSRCYKRSVVGRRLWCTVNVSMQIIYVGRKSQSSELEIDLICKNMIYYLTTHSSVSQQVFMASDLQRVHVITIFF